MIRIITVILALLISCSYTELPAHAKTPKTENKAQNLDDLKSHLDKQEQERTKLQKKIDEIEESLSETQDELVDLAANIRKNNERMQNIKQRTGSLELKKSVLEDKLIADRRSISRLILVLQRLHRTPPESLLARPQSPYETAQTALLIKNIIPSITNHAQHLNSNLETLNQVTVELESEYQNAQELALTLESTEESMVKLLDERKILHRQINQDLKAQEISIQKISLQAKDLEDLIKRLDEDKKREETRTKSYKALALKNRKIMAPIPDTSSAAAELPVSGIIATYYNQKDDTGAKSNGLSIETHPKAIVTAPMSGKVQFTGTFKRYGNLIIIEHKDGYHSLIAGLAEITTSIGQIVHKGEPVGKMPDSSFIDRPKLYYELRMKGKPVDPSIKFADLG
ncbi:MAG: peptidoglycan DD-metalloendopeptidase family protein [Alphaproteobacteria bacterium]|nr:peptidoglycan DD-metalloendopeptidase family protein [Alphaproteobacteria bacterium]